MSFGAMAASYVMAADTSPVPLLSFAFDEGDGNDFYATHGNTSGSGGATWWGLSMPGHGTAVIRTVEDQGSSWQTLTVGNILFADDSDGWSTSSWTALSVMCWYMPMEMTYGAVRVPFAFYDPDGPDWLGVSQDSDGYLETWIGGENTNQTTSPIADNSWAHLAVVWDGSSLLFYIDGAVVASRPTTELPKQLHYMNINGAHWSHAGGAIDDFRLFNVALTPEQVTTFMMTPV